LITYGRSSSRVGLKVLLSKARLPPFRRVKISRQERVKLLNTVTLINRILKPSDILLAAVRDKS
jgi:hypothetical protein